MVEGLESRQIIHDILKLIKINSLNFEDAFITLTTGKKITLQNTKFIHNTTLTSIRRYIIVKKIIMDLAPKINEDSDSFIVLLSSITQLLFLKMKEYAVVNSAVELSKKKNILTSYKFINGCLRSFLRKKEIYSQFNIEFVDLPEWFIEKTKNLNDLERKIFLKSLTKQPSLHLVFKDKKYKNKYLNYGLATSKNSLGVDKKYSIRDIPNISEGEWWVQDFSAMLPLSEIDISRYKKIADVGSAPGGKLFQLLLENTDITSFEKNKRRIVKLNENLKRLDFDLELKPNDFLLIKNEEKFDLIVIDAPCSSVGTIKRNPEIFFKKRAPDFKYLINAQEKLLRKSSKMLKKNGTILYMVCSFLEIETTILIKDFLKENNNYSLSTFTIKNKEAKKIIINNKYINILPSSILADIEIDGFFAVKLIKNE